MLRGYGWGLTGSLPATRAPWPTAGPEHDPVTTRLRLATANILHGRSLSDGLVDDDRMGAAIAALDADVIALQEVDAFQPRSNTVHQTALIAAASDTAHWRFMPAISGEPAARGCRRRTPTSRAVTCR